MAERDEPSKEDELTQPPKSPVCEEEEQYPVSIHQVPSGDVAATTQLSDTTFPGCLNPGEAPRPPVSPTGERTSKPLQKVKPPRGQALKAKGILVNEPRFLKRSRTLGGGGGMTQVAKDFSKFYSNHIYLEAAKKLKMQQAAAASSTRSVDPVPPSQKVAVDRPMMPPGQKKSPRNTNWRIADRMMTTTRSFPAEQTHSSSEEEEDEVEGNWDEIFKALLHSDSDDNDNNNDTAHRNSCVHEEDFQGIESLNHPTAVVVSSSVENIEDDDDPMQMEVENDDQRADNVFYQALNRLIRRLNINHPVRRFNPFE